MIVAVASGKGGTGKTTVSVSLALANNITIADADVEEPNANILFRATIEKQIDANLPFPIIDKDKCTFCETCANFCEYNAIVVLKGLKTFVVKDMCKSCGGCRMVCPEKAITENPRSIGKINIGHRESVSYTHLRAHET